MTTNFDQYRAAVESTAWIDRTSRVRVEVAGPDAAKFLHNLTTNDIKRLAAGSGCEAFVTSPQGKTLAYITILALPDSLLIEADAGSFGPALTHLRKYGVFDDVSIEDRSNGSSEVHIAGPGSAAWLEARGVGMPADGGLKVAAASFAGLKVFCIREAPTGRPGLTVVALDDADGRLVEAFRGSDALELDAETFDALRIEAGTPIYGREVGEKNLPQEIARDSRTISFVKGCYLGQETVARLDALGHVNKILRGFKFASGDPVPPPDAPLEADGKVVGSVTSAAYSPGWGTVVGLGIVRVSHSAAGTEVAWRRAEDGGVFAATVVELPMLPSRP